MARWWAIAALVCAVASARAAEPRKEQSAAPPAKLVAGDPARGKALDPVFSHLRLARMRCAFAEEKQVALLKKPLRSSGVLLFDKALGIVRTTRSPKPAVAVLTKTSLRITKGKRVEVIPLDKSKDLRAFVLVFPTLLRGERAELERSFELGLYGNAKEWWALRFVPRSEALRGYVKNVTVIGHGATLWGLDIVEASGDSTRTLLTELVKDDEVTDEEIAAAFGGT